MPSIIVVVGANQGDYYPIDRAGAVIGRQEDCTIQLIDDEVSRRHMRIRFDPESDQWLASDLDSRHGAFVGSARLSGEVPLKDGEVIGVGATRLIFFFKDFPERESALKDSRLKRWLGEEHRRTFV